MLKQTHPQSLQNGLGGNAAEFFQGQTYEKYLWKSLHCLLHRNEHSMGKIWSNQRESQMKEKEK